jgi:hypothetical protein
MSMRLRREAALLGLFILAVALVLGSKLVRMSKSLNGSNNAIVKPNEKPVKRVMFRRVG